MLRPGRAIALIEATSCISRKANTPGRSEPGRERRMGREPVAKTSLEKDSVLPSASATVRARTSTERTAQPYRSVTPRSRHQDWGFKAMSSALLSLANTDDNKTRL